MCSAAVAFGIVARGAAAQAQTVEEFYKGKRITLIVSYGPGGGYDVFARLLARHIGKYVPGNPKIIVQNMPGAGSLRATNYLYNVAPKDGTAFGTSPATCRCLACSGHNQNVQFDPRKFTWLGSSSSFANDAYVLIVRKDAPVKSVEDARRPAARRLSSAAPPKARTSDACRRCCTTRSASI